MASTFRSVWQGAAFRADLSVNGVGPHASERVTDSEWRALLNKAVVSAWRMAAAARPDFQVAQQDFTVVSGNTASFAVPSWFFDVIDVVFSPDTPSEYSLGPFAWQNRRSPGGWFPAIFGVLNVGGSNARLMGSNIYIEPALRAGGPYRLWFCPMPKLIRADQSVALATTQAIPTYTTSGPAGIGRTLTEFGNGALTIDGVPAVAFGLPVLLQSEPNPVNNGIYSVTSAGSAGSPFVLVRTSIQITNGTNLGTMVQAVGGLTNADVFFETTSLTTVVDTTAWTWAEAFIEPVLEQFSELLELMTAIPAMQRDDDLDPRPLIQRAYGADGKGGLAGEMKAYFGTVRTANVPGKIVDTDRRGPWIGGGW